MANDFNKEEKVAFDQILAGFEDYQVLSKAVKKYQTDQTSMERSNDTIWRPIPYVMTTSDGLDQTGQFKQKTQLSVPASIDQHKVSSWEMDSNELRDALQEDRLGKGAYRKLASDINVAVMNTVANQSTLVVPVATAAGDFDDVALCDSIMNEQGVSMDQRCIAFSSRTYNGLAGNLQSTSRSFGNDKSDTAYAKAMINSDVAGFKAFKLDYANRLAGAAGGGALTIDTQVGATNFHVPQSTSTSVGGQINVDNRYQTITISATTNVAAGDCFTIAGIEAVHHETKNANGQLKTFRVISVTNGTDLVISPPIVSNQGASEAELQYKNVSVAESATAAIVFLNTTTADVNPFWLQDSIEILPGRLAVPSDAGANVMRGNTSNGLELVFQKQYDIITSTTKYRVDTRFGVVNLNPEMSGILLFNQA